MAGGAPLVILLSAGLALVGYDALVVYVYARTARKNRERE